MQPTKKQKQLLDFIEGFIQAHGYSPSFREIRDGLEYRSLAPIAKHIDNLVAKGLLRKRDNSARSLEVVTADQLGIQTQVSQGDIKKSIDIIEKMLHKLGDESLSDKASMERTIALLKSEEAATETPEA